MLYMCRYPKCMLFKRRFENVVSVCKGVHAQSMGYGNSAGQPRKLLWLLDFRCRWYTQCNGLVLVNCCFDCVKLAHLW